MARRKLVKTDSVNEKADFFPEEEARGLAKEMAILVRAYPGVSALGYIPWNWALLKIHGHWGGKIEDGPDPNFKLQDAPNEEQEAYANAKNAIWGLHRKSAITRKQLRKMLEEETGIPWEKHRAGRRDDQLGFRPASGQLHELHRSHQALTGARKVEKYMDLESHPFAKVVLRKFIQAADTCDDKYLGEIDEMLKGLPEPQQQLLLESGE